MWMHWDHIFKARYYTRLFLENGCSIIVSVGHMVNTGQGGVSTAGEALIRLSTWQWEMACASHLRIGSVSRRFERENWYPPVVCLIHKRCAGRRCQWCSVDIDTLGKSCAVFRWLIMNYNNSAIASDTVSVSVQYFVLANQSLPRLHFSFERVVATRSSLVQYLVLYKALLYKK